MNKDQLRGLYLDKRKNLLPAASTEYSNQICNLFFASFDISFIKVVHTFIPLVKNNEPDTWIIIDRIRREFPHIRLSIPRIGSDGNLENFYFEGLHQLKENTWGIQEPKQGIPTPSEKIDLVLVPLLTIDIDGHRVGYGKGYYDRFLQTCRPDCRKIGLSFFEPMSVIIEPNKYDVKLDHCITPARVITF
ncbi:5-formyltetrahydrofolate cyclo-ligase [soil metagenome]